MTEEYKNICNMPDVLDLEIHRSADTGKYYATFIGYHEKMRQGHWFDTIELKKSWVDELVDFLMKNID